MSRYHYRGPLSGLSLPDGREIMLHHGVMVELPEQSPIVATLIARGHLVLQDGPAAMPPITLQRKAKES
jgi:hypothetical protein